MNGALIWKLVGKDWHFQRGLILGVLSVGAMALGLLSINGYWWFTAGGVLLVTVLISLGVAAVMNTIITERTAQTLTFMMTLPITLKEYTTAKILANLLIFLVPWSVLVASSILLIFVHPGLPDGLIAFALIILTELFVSYTLLLAMSLVTQTQTWFTAGIFVGNLGFQAFLFYVANLDPMRITMNTWGFSWHPMFTTILLLEIAVVVVTLVLTFLVQFRKTDLM